MSLRLVALSRGSPCSTSRRSARRRAARACWPTTARWWSRSGRCRRPTPSPIEPPFFAYSGHRGMRRVLVDLKDDDGREAFLALAAEGRRGGRELPARRRRPAWAWATTRCRRAIPGVVYCSTSGYGQTGPAAQWAGHDIDYLAVGGFLAMSTPGADGAPPLPGATVADAAAGGMQAALAITAALAGRAATGQGAYLDVSVADGVLWLMSLLIDEQLALGGESRRGTTSCRAATPATHVPARRREVAGGRRHRGQVLRQPVPRVGLSGAGGVAVRRRGAARHPGRLRRRLRHPDRDEWVAVLAGADTCVAPVLEIAEVADYPQFAARGVVGGGVASDARVQFAQLAPLLAGMERRPAGRAAARHGADGHRAPLEGGRRGRRDRRPLGVAEGGGMTRPTRWPRCATSSARSSTTRWGSSRSSAATCGRRAPRWRTATPSTGTTRWPTALTGGPVAPPSMVSVWFRPHHWAPGRTEEALPLQVHFDLKERVRPARGRHDRQHH